MLLSNAVHEVIELLRLVAARSSTVSAMTMLCQQQTRSHSTAKLP
jgi:predicted transposase YbfD/YdcC